MIKVGNFFFRYRNWLFIFLYGMLLVPSWPLFSTGLTKYQLYPIVTGLFITFSGQLLRALTIGLVYIIRGGREGRPYADTLVTEGIFGHCRNPLYVGNILMLLGLGILANSLLYVIIIIPVFLFVYQSIVLAEENFLKKKFGTEYDLYCSRVNRWLPSLRNFTNTWNSYRFNWRRWILKENTTLLIWLAGIILLVFFKYPELTNYQTTLRNKLVVIGLAVVLTAYGWVRYLKETGRLGE